jgi:hypothetical protein
MATENILFTSQHAATAWTEERAVDVLQSSEIWASCHTTRRQTAKTGRKKRFKENGSVLLLLSSKVTQLLYSSHNIFRKNDLE